MNSEAGSTTSPNPEAAPGSAQDPTVLDPDAKDQDAEEKLRLQLAIFDVTRQAGGRSLAEIRELLLSAFAARGAGTPPETWVESVASSAYYGEPYIIDYPTAIAADDLEPAPNQEVRERLAARRELQQEKLPAGIFPAQDEWNIPGRRDAGPSSSRALSLTGSNGRMVLAVAALAAVAVAVAVAVRAGAGRRGRDA
ncbi:hypothetical protein [Pseudarthrobacter sp. C4D7]|uniref:hypothetical protein n=1 Tax=Pseudarthrobacter sp. C4D7 TaxID=2735268 RepID=UPI0015857BB2|nr:hypothetical protein [Pseudarthrobacter sp. C4D7]NUT69697.1 hypothetical protein [Pseudarthrobacter sp. C4D7]